MELNKEWMDSPELTGIDKAKLTFLENLFTQCSSINPNNKKEMMSFLLSLSKLSRENNISFEKKEVELIYNVIKKHSGPEDAAKMQKISSFFHFQ